MSSRGDAHTGLCNHDDCLDQCCQTAQVQHILYKIQKKFSIWDVQFSSN